MASSVAQSKRESVSERFPPFDDSVSLRLTPTPSGNYRCPVSTPANFVQCTGKIRRTKPLHDVLRSTQPPAPSNGRVKAQRSRLTALSRASRHQRSVFRTGRGIDYYFIDPHENKKEEEATNSHWLRALCAQPVDEILGKYRRRTEVHRAQLNMARACSTPGEKSLITAWESNVTRPSGGRGLPSKHTVKSAVIGKHHKTLEGGHSAASTLANSPDRRTTKSEPALSRLRQNAHSVERYGLSPRTPINGLHKGSNHEKSVENRENTVVSPHGPSQKIKGFLLDEASGDEENGREKPSPPRYVSFTTQLFRQTDDRGNARTYSKVTRGPEHLPYISNSKRVTSMIHNAKVYSRSTPQGPAESSKEGAPSSEAEPDLLSGSEVNKPDTATAISSTLEESCSGP